MDGLKRNRENKEGRMHKIIQYFLSNCGMSSLLF